MFGGPTSIQYWRSYEALTAYARNGDAEHLPAWRAFNRAARRYPDSVGIFHETYQVSEGQWETMYGAMPEIGLLGASRRTDLRRGSTSASRMDPDRGGRPRAGGGAGVVKSGLPERNDRHVGHR